LGKVKKLEVKNVKKLGPLSTDLVVACKIWEYQKGGEKVDFRKLVKGLEGLIGAKSTVLKDLNTLSSWGVIKTEFGETDTGRAGRLYSISGEAEAMIKETYDRFWSRVIKAKR